MRIKSKLAKRWFFLLKASKKHYIYYLRKPHFKRPHTMHKLLLLLLVSLICNLNTFAQSAKFKAKYVNGITEKNLKQHVYTLASDSLKGRDTGSEGEHKAARYIAQHFETYGLKPYNDTSYFQHIGLWSWHWGDFSIKTPTLELNHYEDIVYLSSSPIEPSIDAKCIFIGNGSDSIISKINLKDKIVLATVDNLRSWYRLASKTKRKGALAVLIMHHSDNNQFEQLSQKMKTAHMQSSVYRTKPTFSAHLTKAFAIDHSVAESFFGISIDSLSQLTTAHQIKQLPQPELSLHCPIIVDKANANNVVGYIKGKTKSNEALVISAHYDHIGEKYNGIAYGADDNASGTAAVIELAKAFSSLKNKMHKDIIFLATSGEEKGLLGAFYFADHPDEHHFDIRANINIDMIGRLDSTHKSNYIYTIGNHHYPEFDSLVHVANTLVDPIDIQYDYNRSQGFGNMLNLSDHYAFHRKGIPILGFFSGLHEDYHKITDTPDKIDYQEMENRVKLIFTTAFIAAQKSTFVSQPD